MENFLKFIKEEKFMSFLMALIFVGLVMAFFIAAAITERKNGLMESCLNDGKKDYECYGIIYGRTK